MLGLRMMKMTSSNSKKGEQILAVLVKHKGSYPYILVGARDLQSVSIKASKQRCHGRTA
jgi:hypothetical protein